MRSQRGEAQSLGVELPADGVLAGGLVVTPTWGQCGLEGSFTTHWSAATSQLETTSPLGNTQSSAVLLVQVPASGGRPTLSQHQSHAAQQTAPARPRGPGDRQARAEGAERTRLRLARSHRGPPGMTAPGPQPKSQGASPWLAGRHTGLGPSQPPTPPRGRAREPQGARRG